MRRMIVALVGAVAVTTLSAGVAQAAPAAKPHTPVSHMREHRSGESHGCFGHRSRANCRNEHRK